MNPDDAATAEYIAALLRGAPALSARQLDRLAPLLNGPQSEQLAAA